MKQTPRRTATHRGTGISAAVVAGLAGGLTLLVPTAFGGAVTSTAAALAATTTDLLGELLGGLLAYVVVPPLLASSVFVLAGAALTRYGSMKSTLLGASVAVCGLIPAWVTLLWHHDGVYHGPFVSGIGGIVVFVAILTLFLWASVAVGAVSLTIARASR